MTKSRPKKGINAPKHRYFSDPQKLMSVQMVLMEFFILEINSIYSNAKKLLFNGRTGVLNPQIGDSVRIPIVDAQMSGFRR